jgi:hypothetical protein
MMVWVVGGGRSPTISPLRAPPFILLRAIATMEELHACEHRQFSRGAVATTALIWGREEKGLHDEVLGQHIQANHFTLDILVLPIFVLLI